MNWKRQDQVRWGPPTGAVCRDWIKWLLRFSLITDLKNTGECVRIKSLYDKIVESEWMRRRRRVSFSERMAGQSVMPLFMWLWTGLVSGKMYCQVRVCNINKIHIYTHICCSALVHVNICSQSQSTTATSQMQETLEMSIEQKLQLITRGPTLLAVAKSHLGFQHSLHCPVLRFNSRGNVRSAGVSPAW